VALAFGLPPRYEYSGTLLAEGSEVPDYVVRPTVPQLPDERVRIITDRVMTDENLRQILADNDPYPNLSGEDPTAAIKELRHHLSVKAEDPKLLQDVIGANDTTIAFTVSFTHGSPSTSQAIASDLVGLYLTENQKAQQQLASETRDFLAEQSRRLEQEMAEKEAELAKFKNQHADSLPELSNMNMQLLDRTQRDIETNDAEIRDLRQRVALMQSDLGQMSPYATVYDEEGHAILSPADRLKLLQRQYVQESAIYSQDYPDLIKLRRQIDALSTQTGLPGVDRTILQTELDARLRELENDKQRYGNDHPDVDNLRSALAKAPPASSTTAVAPPDNPAYIERQVELKGAQADLDAALRRRGELNERLKDLESRLTATPEVEREYQSLTRGYQQLQEQYADIQGKQRQADVAVSLEKENKGQRFRVLRSPLLPTSPSQPNRIAILLLGLALAFAAGAGAAAVAEVSDTTVRAPRDVLQFLEIPPLVMIPYIDNDDDVRSRRWKRLGLAVVFSAWAGITVFFIMNPAG
jgi:succinoglycan biosynthesis transport protein ExoP